MRSKHADEARRELLARDRTRPLGEGEIEAELNRLKVLNQINRSGIFENFPILFPLGRDAHRYPAGVPFL